MEALVRKYADKLASAGLAAADDIVIGGLDAEISWNRRDRACETLEELFHLLNINSILLARPAEPYAAIIACLAGDDADAIYPNDCETRTFLHDLPIVREFEAPALAAALKRRKSVLVPGRGIVTFGTVSPEQAFVSYSSVCFAVFVKFFGDCLAAARAGRLDTPMRRALSAAAAYLDELPAALPALTAGPFGSEAAVVGALAEAGRAVVRHRLVDSYFGNISCRLGDTLYISQTASSLDELEGAIDAVPLDGSSCAGITASSEFTAHREVIMESVNRALLHGHPKFSVIMSMHCEHADCELRGQCHIKCPREREIAGVPIVPGEVGTGRRGLARTLPPAIRGHRGAIVYGHGVFTIGAADFNDAFGNLLDIERACRRQYFQMLR